MLQGEHSAILLTFIKLPFVINIFVLSIFDWLFYTGLTVLGSKLFPVIHINCCLLSLSKLTSSKNSFRNTMSNSLDPDQYQHFVGSDHWSNCLQRVSADDIGQRDFLLKCSNALDNLLNF